MPDLPVSHGAGRGHFRGLPGLRVGTPHSPGLHIDGNPWGAALFGTTFYLITGFHGLHVTAGVIYLVATMRVVGRRLEPAASYNVVEITGLYWHFVDLVWIMVFTLMYLL